MEDGQQLKKTVFIIQARMKSSRLPGKILLPLPMGIGRPILGHIIDEIKSANIKSDIVVATSTNSENDVIENFCKSLGVICYRGSENNVLSRFIKILENNDYENVIRLTADNPIVVLKEIKEGLCSHVDGNFDYTCSVGLPLGTNFEIIKANSILSLKKKNLTSADQEHVTLFITKSGGYSVNKVNFSDSFGDLRLTVDYPEDYALLSMIFLLKTINDKLSGLQLVKECFKIHPWLFSINKSQIQKKQFLNEKDELNYSIKLLKDLELYNTATHLTKYIEQQ